MGVATHAPSQAQACLQRSAFGTPVLGVPQRRYWVHRIRLFRDGQRLKPQIVCCFGFYIRFGTYCVTVRFYVLHQYLPSEKFQKKTY
jgi:hypothetical protein